MEQAMDHGTRSLYSYLIGSRNWTWQNLVSSALLCSLVEESLLFETRRTRPLHQATLYILLQTQSGLISVERLFILLTAQITRMRISNYSEAPRASIPVEGSQLQSSARSKREVHGNPGAHSEGEHYVLPVYLGSKRCS